MLKEKRLMGGGCSLEGTGWASKIVRNALEAARRALEVVGWVSKAARKASEAAGMASEAAGGILGGKNRNWLVAKMGQFEAKMGRFEASLGQLEAQMG